MRTRERKTISELRCGDNRMPCYISKVLVCGEVCNIQRSLLRAWRSKQRPVHAYCLAGAAAAAAASAAACCWRRYRRRAIARSSYSWVQSISARSAL